MAIPPSPAARAAIACIAALVTASGLAHAAGHSLRFYGTGAGDVDRVKIRVDDPATALPGPPADVGGGDFTLELWLKGSAAENTAPPVSCGANTAWTSGNVVVDRDRFNADRKFGIAIAGGKVVFGVSGEGSGSLTVCGVSPVLDGAWHHVAVERRRGDGMLWLFVDGNLEAQAAGPAGRVSYPDAAVPANANDVFLVLAAEKFDTRPAFSGWLDELRISTKLRYTANFSRPRAPFVPDRATAALYHFDEGDGATLYDVSGAHGGPSHGQINRGGANNGPAWAPDSPFNVGGLVNNATISLAPFASGFTMPVELVNAGDGSGRLYVVEQTGRIKIIRRGVPLPTPFLDLSAKIVCCSEQGLLGLAFHPNYTVNGRFFVYYTRAGDGALVIERYQRSAGNTNIADAASAKTLIVIPHSGAANHNGGKLAFGRDGYLYAAPGDGGGSNDNAGLGNNAQNLSRRLGKMLRFDVDQNVNVAPYYGIPPTNPFAGSTCDGVSVGQCPEIWAYGLRNPWRFTFDKLTGDLFIADVGQSAREEVDFDPWPGTPGRNYGWRIMEGNICTPGVNPVCSPPPAYAPPIFDYPHPPGISVIGGYRYRGNAIPALAGAYLYADAGANLLWAATRADSGAWTAQQQLLAPTTIVAFGEGAGGELYAVGYGDGTIYRIVPKDSDADALPDWWELAYFGSTTGALAGADSDGDGASNLAEFAARSDPLDGHDVPAPPASAVAVYRPAGGQFYIDYDGDRQLDQVLGFGALGTLPGDVALVGRIDTDRAYDFVIYRAGWWYADTNRDGVIDIALAFGGVPGDQPLLADLNGDERDDLVIYRAGYWYVSTTQTGAASAVYAFGGVPGDVALAGDVDGDGIADLVIYRNGIWYIDTNRDGIADIVVAHGGAPGDKPALFDWNGDGKADLAIFRDGVWFVNTKLDGTVQGIFSWGGAGDAPLAWRE